MKQPMVKQVTINRIVRFFLSKRFPRSGEISIYFLFFILLLNATSTLSFGQNLNKDSTNNAIILFVCEHGAARSTIAAAYFNKLAKEKGLNYKAIFRGINP